MTLVHHLTNSFTFVGTSFNQCYFKAKTVLHLCYIYRTLNLYKDWMVCFGSNNAECQLGMNGYINLQPNSHEDGTSFNRQ